MPAIVRTWIFASPGWVMCLMRTDIVAMSARLLQRLKRLIR